MPSITWTIVCRTICPNSAAAGWQLSANPQSYNRYSYVGNRVLNATDPTGHRDLAIDEGSGAGLDIRLPILSHAEAEKALKSIGQTAVTTASFIPGIGDAIDAYDFMAALFRGEYGEAGFVLAAAALPGSARAARNVGGEVAGVVSHYGDDIVEATGQWHHVISKKINAALSRHETLAGVFGRNDMMVQALDRESHNGYQTWHRLYDDDVVEWLRDPVNRQAAPEQFLQYLRGVYERSDMQKRFPGATNLIDMVLEELP